MLNRLKALLERPRSGADADRVPLAAGVLLVEAAMMDGVLEDSEAARIRELLMRRFTLTAAEAEELLEAARAAGEKATQLLPFTRSIKDAFDQDERIGLIEMLWEVAYADGQLHDYEANLVRRVCGLIYVSDQDSGAARKRALDRLGLS